MRILITGATGQVGYELVRLAPVKDIELFPLGSKELDITDKENVSAVVGKIKPDLIINSAAYTAVDKAETEVDLAYAVNATGVENLAAACRHQGIPLFHISTDYVFSGDQKKSSGESDVASPINVYGASKLAGENALIELCPEHLIMRTSWVFGVHGQNFVKTMLRLGVERDELSVISDQYGSPTSAASIARTLWHLVGRYQNIGQLPWGVYHYCGAPVVSWHQFAEQVVQKASELGLMTKAPFVKAINQSEYPTPAKRPSWSVLSCEKMQTTFGVSQSDWEKELFQVLYELASEHRPA